jgi:hypothetical protein
MEESKRWHVPSSVYHAPKNQKMTENTFFDSMGEHAKFLVFYYCIFL